MRNPSTHPPIHPSTHLPGNGISPSEWDKVIGRRAIRDFKADESMGEWVDV